MAINSTCSSICILWCTVVQMVSILAASAMVRIEHAICLIRRALSTLACRKSTSCAELATSRRENVRRSDAFLIDCDHVVSGGIPVSIDSIFSLLGRCNKEKDIRTGRLVHSLLVSKGLRSVTHLGEILIQLFASCQSLLEAHLVFCEIKEPSINMWHAIISANSICGENERALELYHTMQAHDVLPGKCTILCILKVCANLGVVGQGRLVHDNIISSAVESDVVIGSTLIDMYCKCGSMFEARKVFETLRFRNLVSWTAIIIGYVQHSFSAHALQLFAMMKQEGIEPDRVVFLGVLKACRELGSIDQVQLTHDQVIEMKLESNLAIRSTLVDVYSSCGRIEDAESVFNQSPHQDVVLWNVMIVGYAQQEHWNRALELFIRMQVCDLKPDNIMYSCLAHVCCSVGAIELGRLLHGQIAEAGFYSDILVEGSLIDMYVKFGKLEDAHNVFAQSPERKVTLWNVILAGYVEQEDYLHALHFFNQILFKDIKLNRVTLLCALKASSSLGAIEQGRLLHDQVVIHELSSDVPVGSTLIDMYMKCKCLDDGWAIFINLPNRNTVSWNSIIAGYIQHGYDDVGLELFAKMELEGSKPDTGTFSSILKACGCSSSLMQGRVIHDLIIKNEMELDLYVGSALIDMYAECNSLEEAQEVFDSLPNKNAACWNTLIAGYIQLGSGFMPFQLFERMQQDGLKPDKITFLSVLKACNSTENMSLLNFVHNHIIEYGLDCDMMIGSALVDLYAQDGRLKEARQMFDKLSLRNAVLWGSIIAAYTHHGQGLFALELWRKMQVDGVEPEKATFLLALKACASVGAIDQARLMYYQIIQSGVDQDMIVGSAVVDMYVKCGALREAQTILEKLLKKDSVSWNSLIAGYARNGNSDLSWLCFEKMQQVGLEPIGTTINNILTACSHTGEVDNGCHYFEQIQEESHVKESILPFTCIVDLLSRAGRIEEARELTQTLPFSLDVTVWLILLTACRMYRNVKVGRHCFDQIHSLNSSIASAYVLMSNIYADAHMLESLHEIKELQKRAGICKKAGMAWIEIDNGVHEFIVGSATCSQISSKLKRLVKAEEYVPLFDLVLGSISDEKEDELDLSYAT